MRAPGPRRRRRLILIGVIVAFLLSANFLAYFYTDVLWFQEVGLTSVLWKSISTQVLVGVVAGLLAAAIVWGNLVVAGRLGPAYPVTRLDLTDRPDPFERYREQVTPYLKWLRIGTALLVGLVVGSVASSQWQTFLLWINRVDFGTADPLFGKDVSFYVFELPLWNLVLDQLSGVLIAALLLSAGVHFLQGAIRPERRLAGVSSGALAHLSVLLGSIALVRAAEYWLGTYGLNFSPRGVVNGASYTDVHAQLPALRLLAVISVVSALLFLANIWLRRVSIPLAAVGIWILFAVLAGGLWPFVVQRISVEPQEAQRERPFIARNIEATREAFNLTDVESRAFPAASNLDPEAIETNQSILQNVRLWDPDVLRQAYLQLQAIRPYYTFPDVDIDRYEIGGDKRQVLVSPRELSLDDLPSQSTTWSNLHLQYTHGYGVVASLANQATSSGQPSFLVKDVPGTAAARAESLEPQEPRIYFGEQFDPFEYSVVNSDQQEIDYPIEGGVERSQYEGVGGVPIGSLIRRVAFAVREADTNLILSGLINDESRILYYRNVRDRVLRAAPFLSLDADPYIAVVDGRLVWIVDAYTTTQWYPYAERTDASSFRDESLPGLLSGRINYVRNSVKVVVDAYDGTMDFHIVDEEDPLIQAWSNAFPALFTEEVPSEDLRAHFRYPEDLFELQTEVYLSYHIDDPENFYAREDEWAIPVSVASFEEGGTVQLGASGAPVSPTYLLFQLPEETDQEFVLTRPVTPRNKNNMVAVLVARSDPENYGEILTLQFPRQVLVEGPQQILNLINQDVEISRTISLLNREGSRVSFGSLVVLPIEDSILYIQPFFVTAADLGIPELKRVVVLNGEEVVMEETFDEALITLFGLEDPEQQEPSRPRPGPAPPEAEPEQGELRNIVEEAGRLYERAQAALEQGDFETYGRLIERLGRLLQRAEELSS